MKRVFVDVETTGLNGWKNSIIQLASIIEVDGEEVDEFVTCAPFGMNTMINISGVISTIQTFV